MQTTSNSQNSPQWGIIETKQPFIWKKSDKSAGSRVLGQPQDMNSPDTLLTAKLDKNIEEFLVQSKSKQAVDILNEGLNLIETINKQSLLFNDSISGQTAIFASRIGEVLNVLKSALKRQDKSAKWVVFVKKHVAFSKSTCEHYMTIARRTDLHAYLFLGLERCLEIDRATKDGSVITQFDQFCSDNQIDLSNGLQMTQEEFRERIDAALVVWKLGNKEIVVDYSIVLEGVTRGYLTHKLKPVMVKYMQKTATEGKDVNEALKQYYDLGGDIPKPKTPGDVRIQARLQKLLRSIEDVKSKQLLNGDDLKMVIQSTIEQLSNTV